MLLFPSLRLLRSRFSFRASALAILGLLSLTAFFVEMQGGVAVGNISLNVLVLILSSVFSAGGVRFWVR